MQSDDPRSGTHIALERSVKKFVYIRNYLKIHVLVSVLAIGSAILAGRSSADGQTSLEDASLLKVIDQAWTTTSAMGLDASGRPLPHCEFGRGSERSRYPASQCGDPIWVGPRLSAYRDGNPNEDRFVYWLKVRNGGRRVISEVEWEYDFADPFTGKLLGRHHFSSQTKIKPGRTTTIIEISSRAPSATIAADRVGTRKSDMYAGSVKIISVEFRSEIHRADVVGVSRLGG